MFPFSSLSQPLRTLLHNLSNLRPPHTHSLTSYLIDQMIATREVLYSSSTIKPINLPHNIFSYKNIQNVPNSYQSHNLLVSKLCTLPFLPFCIINSWISIRLVLNQDNFALPLPQPPHCSVRIVGARLLLNMRQCSKRFLDAISGRGYYHVVG